MSGRKFENILRSLNCSEGLNLNIRDRLYKVTVLMNKLIKKFQDSFSPEEALSLDESMLLWRGRLIFRQYIKNKKHKYGIKFYELCSPDGYVLNIEIYKGKNVEVTELTQLEHFDQIGKTIILHQLLKKTLKLKKGPVYVSRWKDKREVFSITTGHHPEMVITSNRFCQQQSTKPRHIVEYNKNMSGIDRSDQMVSYYSSPKKNNSLQLVNKKNIRIRTSDKPRNTSVVLEHVQEKILHPPGWKRKGYYLRCTSQKQVKQTSWICKNCPEKPPLCPGPCFLDYHSVA
ncbi:unnamed protein product [Macrosiphum euphorbiae]|uniref:PiggyBac transposable element-derived protein domain-containing protein n=1 Tax=Macrosiphum euphorbiae TaxID=13131 RepID=A0AAV0W971_9HEMI|nr:unnamed protein product [Macrosiphum euphorbiae]